ncbi:M48 family metalloprotease [Actinomycetospora sp. C-140]
MDGLEGSDAAEAARAHAVDRVERARERLEAFSDGRYPALEAELRQDLARFEKEGDVVPELFVRMRDQVIASVDGSRCLRDPQRVLICPTEETTVNADYRSFTDGTGLIQVCNGLMGLIDLLSKQLVLSGGLAAGVLPLLTDDAFLRASAVRRREDECSRAVDVCLLRWTLLHQRFYGTSSSVYRGLPDDAQRVVDSINMQALQFVVAHECAHHYLGHPSAGLAGVDDLTLEEEADSAALDTLDVAGFFGATDALGALVAVLAVECFEHVSPVRAGRTHPDPRVRAERILERLPEGRRAVAAELVGRVRVISDRARDLTEHLDASWWKTMMEDPDVVLQPRGERDVRQVFEIDRLAAGPLENADRLLSYLGGESGIDLVAIADQLRSPDWRSGLEALGLRDKVRGRIGDRGRRLPFAQVFRETTGGLRRLGVTDPTQRLGTAITLARIIERRVREENDHVGC